MFAQSLLDDFPIELCYEIVSYILAYYELRQLSLASSKFDRVIIQSVGNKPQNFLKRILADQDNELKRRFFGNFDILKKFKYWVGTYLEDDIDENSINVYLIKPCDIIDLEKCFAVALFHITNGPIGMNRELIYPDLKGDLLQTSVKSLFYNPQKINRASWDTFLMRVKSELSTEFSASMKKEHQMLTKETDLIE
ncbi:hypothetical protein WICMUC_005560 [Wickerhamomyces mucosus]|uniref:F-box domain-containing protein n=1 Tax=Wickerhamomyces mucosus TaxID=1378264 RepID=A0A9P8T550_9ASCO|nr:hypothetical protein WICMUC_005560 [Wickerhamomyces mucosus]